MSRPNDEAPTTARYDSYCGLYCGACDILRTFERAEEEHRSPSWAELPEPLRNSAMNRGAPIRCRGCETDDVFSGCAWCPLRKCARRRGDVELCVDCRSYPCWRTRLFDLIAWAFSLERKLPHARSRQPNRERIRCIGQAAWLAEQDKRWRCPQCGARTSWHGATCTKCGREIPLSARYG